MNLRVGGALLRKLVANRNNDTDILHKNVTVTDRNPYDSHIDMANQMSYDYSTVLLLNEVGEELDGEVSGGESFDNGYLDFDEGEVADEELSRGEFVFVDELEDIIVESKAGRLVIFSSGSENLHRIAPFKKGVRYSLAAWFGKICSYAY